MAVNLSDLAAMGKVKPLAALVTAALPGDTPVNSVDNFYKGMNSCAQRWKTGFLGGDTTGSRRDWFVSATLIGEANPQELICRKGAHSGDWLAATGPLGLAAAGLEVLQMGKKAWGWTAPLVEAFSRPQPRLPAGAILGGNHLASSLIDASDGLEASARLLAEASNLGVELDLENLIIHPALRRWAEYRGQTIWKYVLRGGEDYELIFTLSPTRWVHVKRYLPHTYLLGRMLPRTAGRYGILSKRRIPLETYGYNHFKKSKRKSN